MCSCNVSIYGICWRALGRQHTILVKKWFVSKSALFNVRKSDVDRVLSLPMHRLLLTPLEVIFNCQI